MNPKYTRREIGSFVAGLGLAGSIVGSVPSPTEAAPPADYYVAPGDDLGSALSEARAGDVIACESTTHSQRNGKPIAASDVSGTENDPIRVVAAGDQPAVFEWDGGATWSFDGGIRLRNSEYVRFENIVCAGSPYFGFRADGSTDIAWIDCQGRENGLSGLYLSGTTDCLVRGGAYYNNGTADSTGNADGIGMSDGGGNHRFVDVSVYRNTDDGIDAYDNQGNELIRCRSWDNGRSGGNGIGYKLGIDPDAGNAYGGPTGGHLVWNCLAWDNDSRGFDWNNASEPTEVYHCTAWNNANPGFRFRAGGDVLRNNVNAGSGLALSDTDDDHNSWNVDVGDPAFESTDPSASGFLVPESGSRLVGAGASERRLDVPSGVTYTFDGNIGSYNGGGGSPGGEGPSEPPTELTYDGRTVAFDHSLHATNVVGMTTETNDVHDELQWALDNEEFAGDLLIWFSEPGTYSFRARSNVTGDRTVALVAEPGTDVRFERTDDAGGTAVRFDSEAAVVDGIGETGAIAFADGMDRVNLDTDADVRIYDRSRSYDHTVVIDGTDGESDYEFRLGSEGNTAAIEKSTARDATIDPNDAIDRTAENGALVDGFVRGGRDAYEFSGTIVDFRLRETSGTVRVWLDGEEVDPDSLGRPDKYLRIGATGERSPYEFAVSGALEAGPKFDTDGTDGINGSTGTGRVAGNGTDDFYFDGEITDFRHDGPLQVFLNGEEVDPAALATYEHTITFGGQGTYELTVSGDIVKSEANDASIDSGDSVSGSTANGGVNGGRDSYAFDGEIEAISADPSVTALLDGEELRVGKRVEIDRAPDSSGAVDYIVESNGAFETLDGGDEAAGSKAHGVVIDGTDTYELTSGEITDVSTFGGDVVLTVDGTERRG